MNNPPALFALATGLVLLGGPGTLGAQEVDGHRESGRLAALGALNAQYEKQLRELEHRRIADLADLAERSPADVADVVYGQLFGIAIAHGLCFEARAAADRCLQQPSPRRDVRSLASLVRVLGHAERGQYDGALAEWKSLWRVSPASSSPADQADGEIALAVGEAYLQRLIREGRYVVARKLSEEACAASAPVLLKEHFEDRLARLELVGKPAPAIAGEDVDGHRLSLADYKGKIILIDFWATWCPPSIDSMPILDALVQKYGKRGLVIVGVNVDALHENVKETRAALPIVRRFLVNHKVTWPNLQSGQATGDLAAAYRVEQIPANFLIGRDGKVIAVEQSGDALEQAVKKALEGRP
jgi:thiol-disulfide isomerase/thioredoxin